MGRHASMYSYFWKTQGEVCRKIARSTKRGLRNLNNRKNPEDPEFPETNNFLRKTKKHNVFHQRLQKPCVFIVFLVFLIFLVWRTPYLQLASQEFSRPWILEIPAKPEQHMVLVNFGQKTICFIIFYNISGLEDFSFHGGGWRVIIIACLFL